MPDLYNLESVVGGYHISKQVWTPVVGEKLPVDIEEGDANDPKGSWTLKL